MSNMEVTASNEEIKYAYSVIFKKEIITAYLLRHKRAISSYSDVTLEAKIFDLEEELSKLDDILINKLASSEDLVFSILITDVSNYIDINEQSLIIKEVLDLDMTVKEFSMFYFGNNGVLS